MRATPESCKYCQKSTLSVLLLRPSPIATHSGLQPAGAAYTRPDDALVNPLIPPGLTESRPVLRLLRAGYVHLYIPARDSWRTWRVTDQGDLLAQDHPLFASPSVSAVCSRSGHNVSGFKLLEIEQAHELMGQSIWLAFSANQWSSTLKSRNKANPQAMVEVKLGAAAAPAFKPSADALKRQVLECNVHNYPVPMCVVPRPDGSTPLNPEPVFVFTSLAGEDGARRMAEALQKAASRHPKTAGHELAVVLPDPVGYAAELNALRLTRFELTNQELAKPEIAHPLMSLQMLGGLRQSVIDTHEAKSWDAVSPVMSEGAFKDIMRVKPNPRGWPEGTRWERVVPQRGQPPLAYGMGRVIFPDHEARAAQWAAEAARRNWERYRKYVDEPAIEAWKKKFDADMMAKHGEPQRRYEDDWWRACQHDALAQYFARHFDDQARNSPGTAQSHDSGTTYATEVRLAMTPQPLMKGATFEAYLAELNKTPTEASAYLLRALAGNQSEVLAELAAYLQGSRPDKLHDLASGLLKGAEENAVLGRHHVKYGWLLHAAYGVNTLAITQSLTAAGAASLAVLGGKGPAADTLVRRLERLLMGSQAMLLTAQSAIQNTKLEVPMQVRVSLQGAEAKKYLLARQAAGGNTPTVREANRMSSRNGGVLTMTLATTNRELQKVGFDPKAAMAAGLGTVSLGAGAPSVLRPQVVHLSADALAQLMQRQASLWEKAALTLREIVQGAKGATLTLDGHIGLVALLLNGFALYGTLADNSKSFSDAETRWGVIDSASGTVAGMAQVTHSALSSAIASRVGRVAAERSLWVLGAGVAVSGAAAFGGIATAAGQFVKAGKSEDAATQALYGFSGGFFALQGFANLLQFGGAFSEFMIVRGSRRAIWFTGSRVVAGASTRLAAATGMGLTGWGLVFLVGGLLFEVGVVLLTPDSLQKHVQNSYFGKGGSAKHKYKTLADEEKAIRDMTGPLNSASKHGDSGHTQTDPVMVAP